MPKNPNSNHNSIHIAKMLKRLADQIEQMNSTESPKKKADNNTINSKEGVSS